MSVVDKAIKSAMNPILWLSPISTVVLLLAAYVFRDDPVLKYGLAILGAAPVLASLAAYFILLFRDPDRLQSEEFVLRQRELTCSTPKGGMPKSWPTPVIRLASKR